MAIDHPQRLRAGRISVSASLFVFGSKVVAFVLTGSSAIFADAAESVVNVAAAGMLLWSLQVAAQPADSDHPYGHGKIELFTAGLEGVLILAAAAMIAVEAIRNLTGGGLPQELGVGIPLLAAASAMNAGLGFYLVRVGRRTGSVALEADGRHVLAEVWPSVGVVLGLTLVQLTGWAILDPLIALAVAGFIVREGLSLTRRAFDGLMDAADDELLGQLTEILDTDRPAEWIDLHGLRAWRSGAELHADLHLVVPRFWTAEALHQIHDEVEQRVLTLESGEGDVVVHFDPCEAHYCRRCVLEPCPVREAPCEARPRLQVAVATRSDLEVGDG